MASWGKDKPAPSHKLSAQQSNDLRAMMQKLAAEKDVPLPDLRDSVLCSVDAAGDNASAVVTEASAWLNPAVGLQREYVEQIVQTQMELCDVDVGTTTSAYKLPSPCEHDELVLVFDDDAKLKTHYFRTQ